MIDLSSKVGVKEYNDYKIYTDKRFNEVLERLDTVGTDTIKHEIDTIKPTIQTLIAKVTR